MPLLALYCTTVFLSAALLFWVQPLMGKLVLPLVGGTPESWNTCMVFFQALLLAGYGYAHWTTTHLGVRRQAILHCVLILLPLALLPIGLPSGAEPPSESTPVAWLLGLLVISVGAPLLAVSATAPLVQRWFAETGHPSAGDPYFLYSSSNLGSMLALAAFPLVLEPTLRLSQQTWLWSAGYGVLVALIVGCAAMMLRSPGPRQVEVSPPGRAKRPHAEKPVDARRRLRWLALSFVPSSWLLGVTAYVTTDIAPVPLLWIIPLALYLASFILVFAPRQRVPHELLMRFFPLMLLVLLAPILASVAWIEPALAPDCFLLGSAPLPRRTGPRSTLGQPPDGVLPLDVRRRRAGRRLQRAGGPSSVSLAVGISDDDRPGRLAAGQHVRRTARPTHGHRGARGTLALVIAAGGHAGAHLARPNGPCSSWWPRPSPCPCWPCCSSMGRLKAFAAVLAACLVAGEVAAPFSGDVLYTGRGYFGIHRVLANRDEEGRVYHHLVHGATIHGRQARSESRQCEPLTYYHPTGPLGDVFKALPERPGRRVAIVGLGTGAMICYSRRGRVHVLRDRSVGAADRPDARLLQLS